MVIFAAAAAAVVVVSHISTCIVCLITMLSVKLYFILESEQMAMEQQLRKKAEQKIRKENPKIDEKWNTGRENGK